MDENIREARKYILKAYELRDTNRQAAEWCREMASAHLTFNVSGHSLIKRMIEEKNASGERNEYIAGMTAVWEEMHAHMMCETAEVKAMIDTFK